jgi:type I restriction enzyme R subunit
VDYDDKELEKLSLFARNLRPMLRENIILDDEIDLSNIEMSHYRLSKLRQIDIELQANSTEHQLEPSNDVGSATAKTKRRFLSSIIHRLNEVFVTDKLTDQDMINYANTIADKVYENNGVMSQIANNTREQAMLGDFPRAIDDAILGSHEAHREQMMQLLSDPSKAHIFGHLIFDMLANRGQMPLR